MSEQTREQAVALDAWKVLGSGAGQTQGVKDFRLSEDGWLSAARATTLEMAKMQALGKGELEEQLTAKLRCRRRSASLAKRMGSSAV
jgi:hypothetical protein